MSKHTPEGDVARLTDKEIELREWLRSQPGGAERWTVVKAGFRRSYDMGMRDSSNTRPDAEKDTHFDCGHVARQAGCGGCDPGAIELVLTDDGVLRPFDPATDLCTPGGSDA